ncbi:neurofilament heavy polypeptide-like [Ostrinia nubilalis]|uniref:neurofilament heavy polypeptide-like n=1 Tax=Ostrinia nubilalis TaxID=29057 RepID=UPI0030826789
MSSSSSSTSKPTQAPTTSRGKTVGDKTDTKAPAPPPGSPLDGNTTITESETSRIPSHTPTASTGQTPPPGAARPPHPPPPPPSPIGSMTPSSPPSGSAKRSEAPFADPKNPTPKTPTPPPKKKTLTLTFDKKTTTSQTTKTEEISPMSESSNKTTTTKHPGRIQKKRYAAPRKGDPKLGKSIALLQDLGKKTSTGGLRRAVTIKNAQTSARMAAADDNRDLAEVSFQGDSPTKPKPDEDTTPPVTPTSTTGLLSSPELEVKEPEPEGPAPTAQHSTPTSSPRVDHYSIVVSTTPVETPQCEDEDDFDERISEIDQELSDLGVWEHTEGLSEDDASETGSDGGRPSFLPPIGQRTAVSKDLATERAREVMMEGKTALEKPRNLDKKVKAIAVNALSDLYELVLALADSRQRHRLNLEIEKTRSAKELARVEREHAKTLSSLQKEFAEAMQKGSADHQRTHTSVDKVQGWLDFEMDGLFKTVQAIHAEVRSARAQASVPPPKPSANSTEPKQYPAQDYGAVLKEISDKVTSLATELHYIKEDSKAAKTIRYSPPSSPEQCPQPTSDATALEGIRGDLRRIEDSISLLKASIEAKSTPKREDIKTDLKEALAPLTGKAKEIAEGVEELKDITYAGNGPQPAGALGLGAEMALTDTTAQLEDLINPLRADVAEAASQSRTLKETLVWFNSAHKDKQTRPVNEVAQSKSYAAVLKTQPPKKPNHAIIVSSTDPTNTGDKVLAAIRDTLDFKTTGITVERVRKAKNSKVVLTCDTGDNIKKISTQISKNKNLIVKEAKASNPLIKIKNILAYHTDEELVENLKAQNKKVFADLAKEDRFVKVRYRKRARNVHQCHPVLEVSPKLHSRILEAGVLHIGLERGSVEDQSPLIQCSKCLGFGHTKALCKEKEQLCNFCGENHAWQDCPNRAAGNPPKCRNCTNSKRDNPETPPHMAYSDICPERQTWDRIARSKTAYC